MYSVVCSLPSVDLYMRVSKNSIEVSEYLTSNLMVGFSVFSWSTMIFRVCWRGCKCNFLRNEFKQLPEFFPPNFEDVVVIHNAISAKSIVSCRGMFIIQIENIKGNRKFTFDIVFVQFLKETNGIRTAEFYGCNLFLPFHLRTMQCCNSRFP